MRAAQIIEALLFASDAPLAADDIARADDTLDEDVVEASVQELRRAYEQDERAFQIYEVAGGYQILTRPEFSVYLERFATVPQSSRLSHAALEAVAIIAYRQPIDRAEIEDIRGVASAGVLRTLQDRGLVEVVGRGEGLGRPMLYGTTDRFLEHFGFRGLEDLPREEDLPVVLTERAAEVEPAEAGAADGAGAGEDAGEGSRQGGAVSAADGGGAEEREREEEREVEEGSQPSGTTAS